MSTVSFHSQQPEDRLDDFSRVIFAQALIRRYLVRRITARSKRDQQLLTLQPRRTRIVMEMSATEDSYVNQLEILVQVFKKPLKALGTKAGIKEKQIDRLFSNIEEIYLHHQKFQLTLKEIMNHWSEHQTIAPLFLLMVDWVARVYTPYCTNFEVSRKTLVKCQKIPAFQSFLEVNGLE